MDWSELVNWTEYTKLFVGLFALADPIGNLPIVAGLTQTYTRREKRAVVRAAAITFIIGLLILTFIGVSILGLFGITVPALKIGGGILFLFYGLELLGVIALPAPSTSAEDRSPYLVGIVPIGIPLLAGPGTISKVIVYSDLHPSLTHKLVVIIVVVAVGLAVYLLFNATLALGASLGETALTILSKVMGLLLLGIAIEFILEGIAEFFPDLNAIASLLL